MAIYDGTEGNDFIGGTGADDVINGLGGDDVIDGGGGHDSLSGGAGNDTYILYDTDSIINDTSSDNNRIQLDVSFTGALDLTQTGVYDYSGAGIAEIDALSTYKDITLTGNAVTGTTITAGSGKDTIIGGTGNDTINGGSGVDSLVGGFGDDTYVIKNTTTTIDDTHGSNKLKVNFGVNQSINLASYTNATFTELDASSVNANNLTFTGNATTDTIIKTGWGNNHTLVGGSGNDTYVVRNTDTVINDMVGSNKLVIDSSASPSGTFFTVDLNSPTYAGANITEVDGSDFLQQWKILYLQGNTTKSSTLTGGDGRDKIYGGDLSDTINGGGGDDDIDAGDGDDVIDGGEGNNSISGGTGADSIISGSGADNIDGGNDASVDTLQGGLGQDIYTIYDTNDIIIDSGSNKLKLGTSFSGNLDLTNTVGYDYTNSGITEIDASWMNSAITLTGNATIGTTLIGGKGNDTLIGGTGDDAYRINSLNDTIIDAGGSNKIILDSATSSGTNLDLTQIYQTAHITEIDSRYQSYNTTLVGNAASSTTIFAGDYNDSIIGGTGDDFISGGRGNDSINGGSGSDTYALGRFSGTDTIQSISAGGVIQISSDYGVSSSNVLFSIDGSNKLCINYGNPDDIVKIASWDSASTIKVGTASISAGAVQAQLTPGATPKTIDDGLWTNLADTTYNITGSEANTIDDTDDGKDTIKLVGTAGAFAGSTPLFATPETVSIDALSTNPDTIENIDASAITKTDLTLIGNTLNNNIKGGSMADSITGGIGNDTIDGGLGNDTYNFANNDGVDKIVTAEAGDIIQISDSSGITTSDILFYKEGNVLCIDYTQGGSGSDIIKINSWDNATTIKVGGYHITAGELANVLSIGDKVAQSTALGDIWASPYDTAYTVNGSEVITFNEIDGGKDTIKLVANARGGFIGSTPLFATPTTISIDALSTTPDTVEKLDASAITKTNLTLTGNNLNNTITGGKGTDIISGGQGSDVLDGGADAAKDKLDGGQGSDTYLIHDTKDIITDSGSPSGTDTVKLEANFVGAYKLTNTSVEAIDASLATSGKNLTGNAQMATTITGSAFNDTLVGGEANDVLNGGDGNDTYLLNNSNPIINDTSGSNKIKLTKTFAGDLDLSDYYYDDSQIDTIDASLAKQGLSITGNNDYSTTITGGAGSDSIYGGSRNDIIHGGNGNDTLSGGEGVNTLYGDAGNDTFLIDGNEDLALEDGAILDGGKGVDTIKLADDYSGNSSIYLEEISTNVENLDASDYTGDIELYGNSLANVITGGNGGDVLDGGADRVKDTLMGGEGADYYIIHDAKDIIIDNGTNPNDNDIIALADDFALTAYKLNNANIETLNAGNVSRAMNLTGNAQTATEIYGGEFDDTITGGAGQDSLNGGDGNDTYILKDQNDIINDTSGTNTIKLDKNYSGELNLANNYNYDQSQIDIVDGSLSRNSLNLTANLNTDTNITGGSGNDYISGGNSNDTLNGGKGNDTLYGGSGANQLYGGDGNDVLLVDGTESPFGVLDGGKGVDTVKAVVDGLGMFSHSNTGTIYIGDAVNVENLDASDVTETSMTLVGNSLNNVITGGAKDDTIDGNSGIDTLVGGLGNDTYRISDSKSKIVESADGGNDTIKLNYDYNFGKNHSYTLTTANIENVDASNSLFGVSITGNNLDNTIAGCRHGQGSTSGGDGVNTLAGGLGNDTYDVDGLTDIINDTLGNNTIKMTNVSFTGEIDLTSIYQTANITTIDASAVQSGLTLTGNEAKNTTLIGGTGTDTLIGGTGNDTYVIRDRNDYISDSSASNTIKLASNYTGDTDLSSLYYGKGITTIDASALGEGDIYDMGPTGTTLIGGSGDNTYFLNNANDSIIDASGQNSIFLSSDFSGELDLTSAKFVNSNVNKIDTYGNSHDLSVKGSATENTIINLGSATGTNTINTGAGDDEISLTTGTNTINAGNGNNLIEAGDGIDSITAGTGNDTIYGGRGNDTLTGGAGANVYEFKGDAGKDLITATNSTDTISIETVTVDDLFFYTDENDDLCIDYTSGGVNADIIKIAKDQYATGTKINLGDATIDLGTVKQYLDGAGSAYNGMSEADIDLSDKTTQSAQLLAANAWAISNTYNVDGTEVTPIDDVNRGIDTINLVATAGEFAGSTPLFATPETVSIEALSTTANTIENLNASNVTSTNLTLIGNDLDNEIRGGDGSDTLMGGAGNDTYVLTDSSRDTIVDNAGSNTIKLADTFSDSSIDLTQSYTDANITTIDASQPQKYMNFVGNATVATNIIGSDNGAEFTGGSGNDTFTGGSSQDYYYLYDGSSHDTITQAKGEDYVVIDNSSGTTTHDVLFYTDADNNLFIDYTDGGVNGDVVKLTAGKYDNDTTITVGNDDTISLGKITQYLASTGSAFTHMDSAAISAIDTADKAAQSAVLTWTHGVL